MRQIVYISSAREPISQSLCEDILAPSYVRNRRAGVTGLLVAGKRRFLQAIEGPAESVDAVYRRILADPRHHGCVLLADRPVEERQFGDWAMGFCASREAGPADNLEAQVASLVAPLDDRDLAAQFVGFARIQSRAA